MSTTERVIQQIQSRHLLVAEGTSFRALLDTVRKARCAEQMEGGKVYGKRIYSDIGYTELNSFYRAYRRWYGVNFETTRNGGACA